MKASMRILGLLCVLALGAGLEACMVTPGDGSVVSQTATTVTFSGFYHQPGKTVTVTAYDFTTGAFVPIAAATTASTGHTVWNLKWYQWRVNAVIPGDCWKAGGISGHRAVARAKVGSTDLYSVYSDQLYQAYTPYNNWFDCLLQNQADLTEFGSNCTSSRSPNANIRTTDFQDPVP